MQTFVILTEELVLAIKKYLETRPLCEVKDIFDGIETQETAQERICNGLRSAWLAQDAFEERKRSAETKKESEASTAPASLPAS